MRIIYRATNEVVAEGPVGWGITPFEGNLYVSKRYLKTKGFRPNFVPGICPYKFLYVWMDFHAGDGSRLRNLGWLYWLPNPLLPFIWFRVAVPRQHPALIVEDD